MLETRKTELLSQLDQQIQRKTKELLEQKGRVEMVKTQLVSCLTFIEDSMKVKSCGELMQTKKALLKQIKEAAHTFDTEELLPPSSSKVKFVVAPTELVLAYQQYGDVYFDQEKALVSPQNCYASGKAPHVAVIRKKAIAMVRISGMYDKAVISSTDFLACKVVSESTGEKTSCAVKKLDTDHCEVSYKLTH